MRHPPEGPFPHICDAFFLRAARTMVAEALLKPELYGVVRPKVARFDNILRIIEPDHIGIKPFFRLYRFAFSDAQEHLGVRRNFLCRLQRAVKAPGFGDRRKAMLE